jgi:preprotein translocase subunit YajC
LIPLSFLAQTTPAETQTTTVQPVPATTGAKDPPWWANPIMPLVIVMVFLWLFMSRTKKTQERKRTDMLSQLKRGDRVQTIGGIIGKVFEATDHEVVLKVDESANVKMRFTRSAIHKVLEEEKVEAK